MGRLLLLFSRIPPLGLTLRSEFNVSPLDPKAVVFMDPELHCTRAVGQVPRDIAA